MYRFSDKQGSRIRPFSESAQVRHHSYSGSLQRVVTDFGSDHAFGRVNKKLEEHYKISLPVSSARSITQHHAEKISLRDDLLPTEREKVARVIGEIDGSMIPIVEAHLPKDDSAPQDRRKNKCLFWKEARLSLAHAEGSATPIFSGTMGSVQEAGNQLLSCVEQAGANAATKVHCVGDGALWIASQVDEQFGTRGTYLIDFYHLCEYLAAAAKVCSPDKANDWLKEQKSLMKQSKHKMVVQALAPFIEAQDVPDNEAPVRACHRYINNRPKQLDYKSALEAGLPIGSGEVESAHRYVLQERLKIAGAWWTIDNAKNLINLRVCRANDLWDGYWSKAA